MDATTFSVMLEFTHDFVILFILYFSLQEYYVIREWLVPGWLMAVQGFITIAFILTFFSLGVMALELVRWPLKLVLQYEWLMTRISYICCAISSKYSCMKNLVIKILFN